MVRKTRKITNLKDIIKRLINIKGGYFNISNQDLYNLPKTSLWEKVTHLNCAYNMLTVLPEMPNLESLEATFCDLVSLPELPKIKYLDCSYNQLTELPKLPNAVSINCCRNRIVSLPELPNVKFLDCSDNQLTELPEMPLITEIHCDTNQLTSLPKMDNLTDLFCARNQISVINNYPGLKYLSCSRNQLTQLPSFPNLKHLDCSDNQITVLPMLPKIEELECTDNQITIMPKLPNTMNYCISYNNPLYYNSDFNKIHWAIIDFITLKLCVNKWRKFNLTTVMAKKQSLHNELLYSPDLPFYKQTEEYQHWQQHT
ncbi:E3 ubiquitin-protein ligase [Pacmanvirus S19]|nr:E3 ubiquitin-protein ligase [Pacmanvirus S19]